MQQKLQMKKINSKINQKNHTETVLIIASGPFI